MQNPTNRLQNAKIIANFGFICKKMMQNLETFLDEFWWELYLREFGIRSDLIDEGNLLKNSLSEKGQLRRKITLLLYGKELQRRLSGDGYYEHKIVVLGPVGSGKSSMSIRFIQGDFIENYDPTYEDTYRKLVKIGEKSCILDILDTAEEIEYSSACKASYIIVGHCFVFTCSVNEVETTNFEEYVSEVLYRKNEDRTMSMVFVLTKIDLYETEKLQQTLKEFTKKVDLIATSNQLVSYDIFAVSAKTGENIDLVFETLVRLEQNCNHSRDLNSLKQVIELDVNYLKQFKKNKKCSIM